MTIKKEIKTINALFINKFLKMKIIQGGTLKESLDKKRKLVLTLIYSNKLLIDL